MLILTSVLLLLGSVLIWNKVLPGLLAGIVLLTTHLLFFGAEANSIVPILGNSLLISTELGLLILGAFSFYRLLEEQNHFYGLGDLLGNSYDSTAVLLLLGWFLCGFFEGIAGFGIPALLIAPMLIKVGYRPLSAIVLTLSANTLSVCFGALGTPVKIGLGLTAPEGLVLQYVRLLLLPLLILMPVWLLVLATRLEPEKHTLCRRSIGSALLAGIFFAILLFLSAHFVVEFPSVIAGALGFTAFALLKAKVGQRIQQMSYWFSFFLPYLGLLMVLMLLRLIIGFASCELHPDLRSVSFFQPGIVVLAFTLFWTLIQQNRHKVDAAFLPVLKASWKKVSGSLLIILFLVLYASLLKEPIFAFLAGIQPKTDQLPVLAAASGVMGSFVSGSLTMSNLMLADAFRSIAENEPLQALSLAILHIGGALGNALSLQNILVVNAVMAQPGPVRSVVGLNSLTVGLALTVLLALGYGLW